MEAQEAFKKAGLLTQVAAIAAQHPGKRIELWFADAARAGNKGRVCHRWWRRGERPPGVQQIGCLRALAIVLGPMADKGDAHLARDRGRARNLAGVGGHHAPQQAQQCRLARAVMADHPQHLAATDLETDAVERAESASTCTTSLRWRIERYPATVTSVPVLARPTPPPPAPATLCHRRRDDNGNVGATGGEVSEIAAM